MTVLTFLFWLVIAYYSRLYALFVSWLYFLWKNSMIGLCMYVIYLLKSIKRNQHDLERFIIQNDPDKKVFFGLIRCLRMYCTCVDYVFGKIYTISNILTKYYPLSIIVKSVILIDNALTTIRDTFISMLFGYIKKLGNEIITGVQHNIINVISNDKIDNSTSEEIPENKIKMLQSLSAMTETLSQTMGGIIKLEEQHNRIRQKGNRHSRVLGKVKANIE